MKKLLIIPMLILCLLAKAQIPTTLKTGDKVPETFFTGTPELKGRTPEALYKKGLLILNLWATWCIPCIKELPRLDSLQQQLKEQLTIISVSTENPSTVELFLKKNPGLKNLSFVSGDKTLSKAFAYKTIPHNIWIDTSGKIIAQTDDWQITAENISAFLTHGKLPQSKEEDLSFDYHKFYKIPDTITLLQRSTLTGFNPRISNGGQTATFSKKDQPIRFFSWNDMKLNLIWNAVMKKGNMRGRDWNFIEVHTRDSASFFYPKERKAFSNWQYRNQYCYELIMDKNTPIDTFYRKMQSDLEGYFKLRATKENRMAEVWVITKKPNTPALPRSAEKNELSLRLLGMGTLTAKKQFLAQIAARLSMLYPQQPPFVDETGISYPIDIYRDFGDQRLGLSPETTMAFLESIGLQIKKETRPYPFLIVHDLN